MSQRCASISALRRNSSSSFSVDEQYVAAAHVSDYGMIAREGAKDCVMARDAQVINAYVVVISTANRQLSAFGKCPLSPQSFSFRNLEHTCVKAYSSGRKRFYRV